MEALVRVAALIALLVMPAQALAGGKCKRGDFAVVTVIGKVKANTYEVENQLRERVLLVTKRKVEARGYMCLCTAPGKPAKMEDANGFPIEVQTMKDVGTPDDECTQWSGF